MMKLLLLTVACLFVSQSLAAPSAKIESRLLDTFRSQKTANIVINMREGTSQVLEGVTARSFSNRVDRIQAVADALMFHADRTQKAVWTFLDSQKIEYSTFWISNQIFINDASLELAEKLATIAEIGEISEEIVVQLDEPIDLRTEDRPYNVTPRANQWGVEKIEAHLAWATTDGRGVVVGGIDTGVRGTHVDLRASYRADYGWIDPTANQQLPYDNNGHGTHTVGSICGANGLGVAPGAQWIACKGCASSSCSTLHLTACGQFMLCPTRPDGTGQDCSKAPNVVSNSWAGGRGDTWYDSVTNAWIAANIIPVFAIGNAGSRCSSDQSPGDRNVIGVGATTVSDSLASFSSRGPANDGRVKPEVSAPGSDVYSAYHTSDTAYGSMSGTSMACPHAAGAVALILSARPGLTYNQVKTIVQGQADTTGLTPPNTNCGGVSDGSYPNNAFGSGRLNARRAVTAALAL